MAKLRAVAYIRVSTKSDAQIHSFGYQMDYWVKAIGEKEDCEYAGVYADKGISGKSLTKRPQFLKLLADARQHRFDIVFTKSVARFGRNTEELLETVRELRDLGIKVFFEKEQIDTFNPTAETYLTIAASIAENDLQIYSENMKWSIRHRYQNGWFSVGSGIFGYRMNKETNTLQIEPSEADTVRRIFDLYLQGYGTVAIGMILEKEGRPNSYGEVKWNRGALMYMLTNEKYKGCALSQKYIGNLGVCRINKDTEPKYYIEDSHEAIVSKEIFDKVQSDMARRGQKRKGQQLPTYAFTKKIVCGNCGHGYVHKINSCGKPWANPIWICCHQNIYGVRVCDNRRIKDAVLKEKFVECYNEFITSKAESVEAVELRKTVAALIASEKELNALYVNKMIDANAFHAESASLRKEIESVLEQISAQEMHGVSKEDFAPITEYADEKVEKFIERVTICNNVVTFTFINGAELSREYTNGPAGNQKGWYDKHLDRIEQLTAAEV